jgi:hypothetical protein
MKGEILPVDQLVKQVKQHALDNYEKGGWDILIECHTEAEIAAWIGKPMTKAGAIRKVAQESGIRVGNSVRADVQGEVF